MTQDEINAVKKAAAKMREQDAMNDEIIEMAIDAGLTDAHYENEILLFAKLVAAKEREACAKVCEVFEGPHRYIDDIVEAIRARGEA